MSLSDYNRILRDIADLKIQGATNVAIWGLKAIKEVSESISNLEDLKKYANKLLEVRPTEPLLKNSIRFLFNTINDVKDIESKVEEITNKIREMKEKAIENASRKIFDGAVIFTHCHSSTVTGAIIKAFNEGKEVRVINTETRPRYQGRITARELSEAGIEVTHIVDSAMAEYLRKADIVFIGADAISSDGYVINKIGSKTLAILADLYDIPLYSITVSWKFDPDTVSGEWTTIEKRDPSEVWENAPNGVKIENPAFSLVPPKYVTGVITELGVFSSDDLYDQIKRSYPEILK